MTTLKTMVTDWIRVKTQGSHPATPAAGYGNYYDYGGAPYFKNAAGTEISLTAAASDTTGWNSVAWGDLTRVSNTSFSTTTDITGIVQKGDKLKFTDTTVKYATISALSAYSSGSMTITVLPTSDYIIVGNPSVMYYSHMLLPGGWPVWFNFTTSPTNLTIGGGTMVYRYAPIGRVMHLQISFTMGAGSAMGGGPLISTPAAALYPTPFSAYIEDSGTAGYVAFFLLTASSISITSIGTAAANAVLGYVSSTGPFTWTTNDYFVTSGSYEW